MPKFKVKVTHINTMTKLFLIDAATPRAAESEALAQAPGSPRNGWTNDPVWEAKAVSATPRVGDVVRYSAPEAGEDCFRFVVLEIVGGEAVIQLVCKFTVKPTERVRLGDICLASTED